MHSEECRSLPGVCSHDGSEDIFTAFLSLVDHNILGEIHLQLLWIKMRPNFSVSVRF